MHDTPEWALTLSFWLHMLATVSWVGGLAVLSLFVFPIARRSLEAEAFSKFVRAVNMAMATDTPMRATIMRKVRKHRN